MNQLHDRRIAIVGYGYRMPGGITNDQQFWDLLKNRDVVQVPIETRYGKGYEPYSPDIMPGKFASPYEGLILDNKELAFDCKLFGMSSFEGEQMDPQIKLLLSSSWEAFEHAGWDMQRMRNSNTGVYIGTQVTAASNWRSPKGANEFFIPGTSISMFANRISYHFNLMGPSTTTMTACSSGVSAMHAAMNALKCGDCEQAVVGSANYLGSYMGGTGFASLGVISPDGRCHSFDEKANGYMRSEGVFIFLLKPVEAAERDGDVIHAVIADTMLNTAGAEDGATEMTQGRYITAPTGHAQNSLMRSACDRAGISRAKLDYLEAHATGTKLGDFIEGNAIGEVFGVADRETPLRVSGVKSNLGHMEAAAFHCSLLKVILMMQRRTFAPISNNYTIANPDIDFDAYQMKVQTECEPFPDRLVTAGINSFGFGGANGMCILEEYSQAVTPSVSVDLDPGLHYMLPLSARSPEALAQSANDLKDLLATQTFDMPTLAANLSRRRTHFSTRTHLVGSNTEEIVDQINTFVSSGDFAAVPAKQTHRMLMVFSGQGTQWAGCLQDLYAAQPVFRRVVDAIDEYWQQSADHSLKEIVFSASQEELDECQLAQPVIFLVQCALVELYKTWGVYADAVTGHSAGEMAAAYACGALSLESATRLVYHRSRVQQRTAGSGRMLAIALDRTGVEDILDEIGVPYLCAAQSGVSSSNRKVTDADDSELQVEFACINSPVSIVICGKLEILEPVIQELSKRNVPKKLLRGNIAFHSSAMDIVREDLFANLEFLNHLEFEPDIPFISTVTGQETVTLDSAYWWSNIRQPVRFFDAMAESQRMLQPTIVLEISPDRALTPVSQQCFENAGNPPIFINTLLKDTNTDVSFHRALGRLYEEGLELDFDACYPHSVSIAHKLPGHPKSEQSVLDKLIDDTHFLKRGLFSTGPLVGRKCLDDEFCFEVRMSAKDFPWLMDHRVQGGSIVPAAGYIEMIVEALDGVPIYFEQIQFLTPCEISDEPSRVITRLEPIAGLDDSFNFTISSKAYEPGSVVKQHCQGRVQHASKVLQERIEAGRSTPDRALFEATRFQADGDFYDHMDAVLGDYFQYGSHFQSVKRIAIDNASKELLLDLEMDESTFAATTSAGFHVHPSLLDGGLQSFIYFLMQVTDVSAVPIQAKNLTILRAPTSPHLVCHYVPPEYWKGMHERGQLIVAMGEQFCGSVTWYDGKNGDVIAHLGEYYGFHANSKQRDLAQSKHALQWQPKFFEATGPSLIADAIAAQGEVDLLALLQTLETRGESPNNVCRIVEFTNSEQPNNSLLERCIEYLNDPECGSEYWVIGSSDEVVQNFFDTFSHNDAALRFETGYLQDLESLSLGSGLLRFSAADVICLNLDSLLVDGQWNYLRSVLVPGGMLLVNHADMSFPELPTGWSSINQTATQTLIQSPISLFLNSPFVNQPDSNVKYIAQNSFDMPLVADPPDLLAADNIVWLVEHDASDVTGCEAVTDFVLFLRELASYRIENELGTCRLTVVTVNAAFEVEHPKSHVFYGAVRSAALELAAESLLSFQLLDFDADPDKDFLERVMRLPLREQEIAIRGGRLFVPRVVTLPEKYPFICARKDVPYRLCIDHPGQISGLQLKTVELPNLGPDDVEIEIKAAALNFRDIMVVLGKLPLLSYEHSALGHHVGMEACGTVIRAGEAVTDKAPGDEVIFMQGGCIGNRAIVNASLTFHKPMGLTQVQAAGVMSVYVTAYYALMELARLKNGQRVLIHSGMGGVGQAAIALARHTGAEIYATAGSVEKRDALLKLGAKAAFDSHSHAWYDDLMEATSGEGVDVVLNSLAGHHITLCLDALRPGGWHCEIGKVDIYADNTLNLCVFRKNLRFAAIDVDRLMTDDPDLSRQISEQCLAYLSEGLLPSIPVTCYPVKDYPLALRHMMNGEHQGKLILQMPESDSDAATQIADVRPYLDPTATYFVTGAFGGLGLRLVAYLAASGAKHLSLMDRDNTGKRSPLWLRERSGLAEMFPDVEVHILHGDVTVENDVVRCMSELQRPLKGVFHLAGTIADSQLDNLDAESFDNVFNAKARGACYLHHASLAHELDHFVVASSVAAAFGAPSQINYAAANSYLDGLVMYRRRQGLPAFGFNIGGVAEAGMAARDGHALRMLKAGGIPAISALFAFHGLDYGLRTAHTNSHVIAALFKRLRWSTDHPDYMRFGRLINNQDCFSQGTGGQQTPEAVKQQILQQVVQLCGHDEVNPDELLASYGLTSISVVELASFINTQFNYNVSIIELMTKATTSSLVDSVMSNIEGNDSSTFVNGDEPPVAAIPLLEFKRRARKPSEFASNPNSALAVVPRHGRYDDDKANAKEDESSTGSKLEQAHAQKDRIKPLDGSLPPACQSDLSDLKQFVRGKLEGGELAPSKSPDDFRKILITGATGFIGRFVLRDILQQNPDVEVFCVVRANDAVHGLQRVKAALQLAEIWEDGFSARMSIVPGDIGLPHFGLADDEFVFLCEQIDAVYHFAADLSLASPYDQLRAINTISVTNVLDVCLSQRFKHLFYASTLGIFPQYFCQFAKEFRQMPIEHQAQPDLAHMKHMFPLGFLGYPWSKLVVEQALLYARSAGLPVALFRFPLTGIAAKTGFTEAGNIKIRLATSAIELGMTPPNLIVRWTEPVDTLSRICTAISLSAGRKHTIYQFCNPDPIDHDLSFEQLGFNLEPVSYQKWKTSCLQEGEKSPLSGHWTLVDYFAQYWFGDTIRDTQPVSDKAIREDCPFKFAWPGVITQYSNSSRWIHRHQESWPYQLSHGQISLALLESVARDSAEEMRVPFDQAYPPRVLESLGVLVKSLAAPSAELKPEMLAVTAAGLSRRLINRAALLNERKRFPEIQEQSISRPVFIVGINRTGTTFLHNLLSQDARNRSLKLYEMTMPVIANGDYSCLAGTRDDPRKMYIQDVLEGYDLEKQLRGIHRVDIEAPEEEFSLLEHSFTSWSFTISHRVPEYAKWLANTSHSSAYETHFQMMQHFNWQRNQKLGVSADGQWLFKMPFHLMCLDSLLETYPDALFIQTHRDPCELMSSWNHLVDQSRSIFTDNVDKAALGKEQLEFMSRILNKASSFRESRPDLKNRWMDIAYLDLIKNPMGAVEEIYQWLDRTVDSDTHDEFGVWLQEQAEQRANEKIHTHVLDDYGVSVQETMTAFAPYLEFMSREMPNVLDASMTRRTRIV